MPRPPVPTLDEVAYQVLRTAHLTPAIYATCVEALSRPGRLFSANPAWSRLFLAWIDALTERPRDVFLPAAVACECLATGYDLIDDLYDGASGGSADGSACAGLVDALPAGVALLLLAQEVLTRLDLPPEPCRRACASLARASRRVFAGQAHDYALRSQPPVTQDAVLAVMRRRSGTLVAAPCQCAALLAGAPWRVVALAGCFGHALGCAAQLEDDLADCADDLQSGRQTIPTLLTRRHPAAPEVVEATTWVLTRHFLQAAAQALRRLPDDVRTDPLWTLLPPSTCAASRS